MTVTAVNFGATPAASFVVNSATQITAVVPPGLTGTVAVRVTTGAGQSAAVPGANFTAAAAPTPTISTVAPNTGPAAGGTSVTITGANFTGATAVRFGATNAASFTVNSATSITATSPAGSGNVNVTVVTPDGTSNGVNFGYAAALTAPVITSSNSANATEGTAFSYTITASGNPAPAVATGFNATGLPAWLTRTNNVVSGTPPAGSGNTQATFTVTATNSEGTSPGVLVTVNIAEPAGAWELTHAFTVRPTFNANTGRVALSTMNGYAAHAAEVNAVMSDDLYDLTSMAEMPVQLWAKYPSQAELLITFDNFGGTGGVNTITNWGWNDVLQSIYLVGANSTGADIQLRLISAP